MNTRRLKSIHGGYKENGRSLTEYRLLSTIFNLKTSKHRSEINLNPIDLAHGAIYGKSSTRETRISGIYLKMKY